MELSPLWEGKASGRKERGPSKRAIWVRSGRHQERLIRYIMLTNVSGSARLALAGALALLIGPHRFVLSSGSWVIPMLNGITRAAVLGSNYPIEERQ